MVSPEEVGRNLIRRPPRTQSVVRRSTRDHPERPHSTAGPALRRLGGSGMALAFLVGSLAFGSASCRDATDDDGQHPATAAPQATAPPPTAARPATARPPTAAPAVPVTTAAARTIQVTTAAPAPRALACCRTCSTGKACGDSCISRSLTCHKGPGCACNADGSR